MKPDLVALHIPFNFLSRNIFFGHALCRIVMLLISYASCVSVRKRVTLIVFVSVIILSEVQKIDTCTKLCSRLFLVSDGKGETVDKGNIYAVQQDTQSFLMSEFIHHVC